MKTDFLSVDKEISGQNYVCLSFISPENVLKNKEIFMVKEFINSLNKELKLDYKDIYSKYEDFKYRATLDKNSQLCRYK